MLGVIALRLETAGIGRFHFADETYSHDTDATPEHRADAAERLARFEEP